MPSRHDMNSAGGETILGLRKEAPTPLVERQMKELDLQVDLNIRLTAAVIDRDGKIIELGVLLKAKDAERAAMVAKLGRQMSGAQATIEQLRGQVAHLTELLRRTAEYAPEHIAQQWSAAEVSGEMRKVCGIERASNSFWKNQFVPQPQPIPEPSAVRIQHDFSDHHGHRCARCGVTKKDVIGGAPVTCLVSAEFVTLRDVPGWDL